jgi:MFS family permease
VIVLTILCFASFMIAFGYIIPSTAEDDHVGFGASGQTTALLLITPAAVVQLIASPLIGRLAVRIGFVTVLRAGLIGAVAVTALFAIFAFSRNMVVLLMPVFGIVMAASLTPIAALGVIQAPKDAPGSLLGKPTLPSVSAGRSDSLGPERLSRREPRRGSSPRCGSASPSASPPWRRASSSSPGRLSRNGTQPLLASQRGEGI